MDVKGKVIRPLVNKVIHYHDQRRCMPIHRNKKMNKCAKVNHTCAYGLNYLFTLILYVGNKDQIEKPY